MGDRRAARAGSCVARDRRHHRDREPTQQLLLTVMPIAVHMGVREMVLVAIPNDPASLSALLAREGFIAAAEESEELLAYAAGDAALLDAAVATPLTGEPLAWITGSVVVLRRRDPRRSRRLRAALAERTAGASRDRAATRRTGLRSTSAPAAARSRRRSRALVPAPASWRPISMHAPSPAPRSTASRRTEGDLFAPLPRGLEGQVDVVVGRRAVCPDAGVAAAPAGHLHVRDDPCLRRWRRRHRLPRGESRVTVLASSGLVVRSCSRSEAIKLSAG